MLSPLPWRRRLRRHDAWQVRRHAGRRFRRDAAQPRVCAQRSNRPDLGSAATSVRRVPHAARARRGLRQLGRAGRLRCVATPRGADGMSALAQDQILADANPEDILRWAYETFANVAVVASFQAESSVIIDMVSKIRPDFRVLTLDTGRLPQETHDMIDRVRDRYQIAIDVLQPDPAEMKDMVD